MMVDYVVTATMQDGISAGADAATAALNKTADAADNLTAAVTRVGPSAQTLVNKLDDTTRATNSYQKAVAALARDSATLDAGVAAGTITETQRAAVLAKLQSNVMAAQQAMANTVPASDALSKAHGVATVAANGASEAHAGFYREIVVLGHEMLNGNYSRIPGSMAVLAERSGSLNTIFSALGTIVTGWGGPFTLAIAGMGAMGYAAETNQRQLLGLQAALMATRADYVSMASEAQAAARAVAGSSGFSGFSGSDTLAAAQAIGGVPNFVGSQQQLESLIRTAGDLATVWGQTLPDAAKVLAKAMQDPGAEADELAKQKFPGMTQALVDQIKSLENSGNSAAAFGKVLDALKAQTNGAAVSTKTDLQQALTDLGNSFSLTGKGGRGLGDDIVWLTARMLELVAATNWVGTAYRAVVNGIVSGGSPIPPGVTSQIYSIAQQANFGGSTDVSAAQADLAIKIAKQESGGRQFDSSGNVLTSPAGAIGVMGLMPGTAADLGVNPYNQQENIAGGEAYIAQLWSKYNGDPALVAMAYNWGPGNVDAFLAGNKAIAQVPKETQAYVQAVAGVSVSSIPTAGAVNVGGVTDTPQQVIDKAVAKADQSGVAAVTAGSAQDQIKLYTAALADLAAQGDTTSLSVQKITEALQKANVEYYNAIDPVQKLGRDIDQQIAGQDQIAQAWQQGAGAAVDATNAVKAQQQALQYAAPGTQQYATIVAYLTDKYNQLSAAQQGALAAQDINKQQQQLQVLQEESNTLGETADVRARDLATMQAQQYVQTSLTKATQAERDAYVANAQAISDATQQLAHQQAALQEVANIANQISDQIGQGLVDAFVSGQGAAVSFGGVAKAILADILNEVIKLAVVAPIINSLFGTNQVTLGGVVGALGGGSGSSGGADGGSLLSSGGSLLNLLGMSGIGDSLGITGAGGLLGTTLWSSSVAPTGFAFAGEDAGLANIANSEALSGTLGASTSLGSLLGGAGLGIGAGMLINSLWGAKNPTSQAIGTAGSIVGAVGGAALGSVILPGVGTVLGGLLGGMLGGSAGLFGPGPENPWSQTSVGVGDDGLLSVGGTMSQVVNTGPEVANLTQQLAQIDSYLTANKLAVNSDPGIFYIGQGGGPYKFSDMYTPNETGETAFQQLQFHDTGTDSLATVTNTALSGQTFATLNDLATAIQNVDTFVNTTVPSLEAFGTTTGSLQQSIDSITSQFSGAIATAHQLNYAESDLTAARDKAIQAAKDAVTAQIATMDAGFNDTYLSAAASISGSPTDALAATLASFDTAAQQQTDQLTSTLVGIYGDSYKATADYADQMALLEKSLGEQRLAIQAQYNNQLAQTAEQAVTSLSSYVSKLALSSNSPLSPQDQYGLASTQFNTDLAAAEGGSFTAYSGITNDADTLLSASRALYGSGTGYVTDFQRVLDALGQLASVTPDTLTNDVLISETRTQTQQLSDSLAAVVAAVNQVNSTLVSASGMPARVGA